MRTAAAVMAAAWAVAALSTAALVSPVAGWASGHDGICEVEGVALANGSYAHVLFQATVSDATTSTWFVWYNRTARREPGRRATASPPPQQRQPNASVVVWQYDAGVRPDQAELARTGGCPPLSGVTDPALRVAGYDKFMSTCQVVPSSPPSTEETVTCASIVTHSVLDDGARLAFGLSVCDTDVTGAVRYYVQVADAYRVSSCPLQDSPLALVIGASLLAAGTLLLVVAGACLLARRRRRDTAAAPEERVELRAAT